MQTVDLKTSKALQQLLADKGIVPLPYTFSWQRSRNNKYNKWRAWEINYYWDLEEDKTFEQVPTYTLDEMLELLPEYIDKKKIFQEGEKTLRFQYVLTSSDIEYVHIPSHIKLDRESYQGFKSIGVHNQNRATAAASLYIRLCENRNCNGGGKGRG